MQTNLSEILRHKPPARTMEQWEEQRRFLMGLVCDEHFIERALEHGTIFSDGELSGTMLELPEEGTPIAYYELPSGQVLIEVGDSGLSRVFQHPFEDLPLLTLVEYNVKPSTNTDADSLVQGGMGWDFEPITGPRPTPAPETESRFYFVDTKYLDGIAGYIEEAPNDRSRQERTLAVARSVMAFMPWSWSQTLQSTPHEVFQIDPAVQDSVLALRRFLYTFYHRRNPWVGVYAEPFRQEIIHLTQTAYAHYATRHGLMEKYPHSTIEGIMNHITEDQNQEGKGEQNGTRPFDEQSLKPCEELTVGTDPAIATATPAAETDAVLPGSNAEEVERHFDDVRIARGDRLGMPRSLVEGAAHDPVRLVGQAEAPYLESIRHVKVDPSEHARPRDYSPQTAVEEQRAATQRRQDLIQLNELCRRYFGHPAAVIETILQQHAALGDELEREQSQEDRLNDLTDRVGQLERAFVRGSHRR